MAEATTPDGVQAFSWITLSIFERLYDAFPEKYDIRGALFAVDTVLKHGPESNESRWSMFLPASVAWLEREGFIVVDGRGTTGDFLGVTLTLKGFTALGHARESRHFWRRRRTIESIRAITKAGVSGASAKAAEILLGKIFSLASGS